MGEQTSTKTNINWFPGHMAKTRRAIQSSLKLVDIVAELIDARIPVSSRNPILKKLIGNKPRLILMNKSDMADSAATARWIAYYKQKGVKAIALDCRTGKGVNGFMPAIREVLQDQIARWEAKGMTGRPIRVMVVGIPNVGKSSLINTMCRGGNAGKADVQDRPGVTRQNRWFTIGKGFELLDTPGVLWPKFDDPIVGERLAFTGAVKDDVVDVESLASRLLEVLRETYPQAMAARYKLEGMYLSEMQGYELLELVGRKRGFLISGGEINTERAAITVLDEFRSGKLGKITLELP